MVETCHRVCQDQAVNIMLQITWLVTPEVESQIKVGSKKNEY